MKLGEDYSFIDDLKTDTIAIKLLTGNYKDIVYRYKTLSVREEKDKSSATMTFDYDIIDPGSFTENTLRKNKLFEVHLGLVLNALILDAADMVEHKHKIKGNDGKDNITESSE